jgi:hypothetical protein
MYYNSRDGAYRHHECARVEGRNNRKTKTQLSDSAPKRFVHPGIGKCPECKKYDSKDNFYQYNKRKHPGCTNVQTRNSTKMKQHKTDTCAFTGLPFGDKSEMKPVGDHDHDTLLYRGHIWSAANRLEGALKFIMQETGCSIDEVFEMTKNYLAKPGIDIGLEPYPQLGFATADEAIKHYETTD